MGVLLTLPSAVDAQGRPFRFSRDSAPLGTAPEATTSRRADSVDVQRFPADSIEGLLLWRAGVIPADDGVSVRGGPPGDYAAFLNGVDISPGSRRVRLLPSPHALRDATVVTGPLPATIGGSRSGALLLETRVPGFGRTTRARWESDRLVGSSLGYNRIEGEIAGATRRSRVLVATSLTGQKSAEFGAGAHDVPIFQPAGIDTAVAVPSLPGDPAADTAFFAMPSYAVARGGCERFESNSDPGVAANFGLDCGERTPASARSGFRLLTVGDHDVGRASRLTITSHRARESARLFSYPDLFHPQNLRGREAESRSLTFALHGALDPRRASGYRIGLSRQSDELLIGPLTPDGESKSRDPAGGFLLGGLDFRWDFESFPVDSALVANYRANRPGTRRSPYVLERAAEYGAADRFREGPYGLRGFIESGGPDGPLTLFRERRTLAFATGRWTVSQNAVFTAGGEYVRYDVASYDHALTSQAGSDVYRVRPRRGALYAEDRLEYGPLIVIAGVRYDFFSSRADRPEALDTVRLTSGGMPNPTFGTYLPIPRISSYGEDGATFAIGDTALALVSTRRDGRHSVWTPRLRASVALGDRSALRAAYARHARMPDLRLVFAGLNTDLAITTPDQLYGSDLGLERSSAAELGVRHRVGARGLVDVSVYRAGASRVPVVARDLVRDPAANSLTALRQVSGTGRQVSHGAELVLGHDGDAFDATVAYTLLRVRADDAPTPWERPHTLTGTVGYTAPPEVRRGIMRGASLQLALRVASGLPYDVCPGIALSDEACDSPTLARARMPAFRQLDLRFQRRIAGRGGREGSAVFYLDVRNVFNRTNVLRVFRETGTTSHPDARTAAIAEAAADLRSEAGANGVLLPDGSVGLTFDGNGATGCAGWLDADGRAAAPNCVSLIRAETRYGNGDGRYTPAEQAEAAGAWFEAGVRSFNDAPRRIRVGLEIGL